MITDKEVLLAAALVTGLILAKQYPIHVRAITRLEMATIPLVLLAALFPPTAAPVIAFVGIMLAEVTWRKRSGLGAVGIVIQALRLSAAVIPASVLLHLQVHAHLLHGLVWVGAAAAMWAIDLLTAPAVITPLTGESPLRVVREAVAGTGASEAGQYALALIGVALASLDPWAATMLLLPAAYLYKVSQRAREAHESTLRFLENMADSVDARDPFTPQHSQRVAAWTGDLLRELGASAEEAYLIATAARLHDIGKIGLPQAILGKHGALDPAEWVIMERHPVIGAETLKAQPAFVKSFGRGPAIVRGHHERWDGRGYPDRLAGPEIPFGARVIAVVDSFEAMTSDRPYRKAMTWERAAAVLSAGRGTQWDPEVVSAFLRILVPRLEAQRGHEAAPGGEPAALPGS